MPRRIKFGPSLNGIYPRPTVAGELPDVEPTMTVVACRAVANGLQDFDVAFTFPAHDPTTSNAVAELHLVVFGPGQGIPTDPKIAKNSPHPKTRSTPPASLASGGDHLVTVKGCDEGNLNFISVLEYEDGSNPDSTSLSTPDDSTDPTQADAKETAPSDSTTPPDVTLTAQAVADPSAASTDPVDPVPDPSASDVDAPTVASTDPSVPSVQPTATPSAT
jgi:hypothetical protein